MQLIIFCGLQASGKSTFFQQRFSQTHLRLNMDMLKTRHREQILFNASLEAKQPVVIDNTNPTVEDRARYIAPARAARFQVIGYYFQSKLQECKSRNAQRSADAIVPDVGILGTHARLVLPTRAEGFDQLYYVKISPVGGFEVEEWSHEL